MNACGHLGSSHADPIARRARGIHRSRANAMQVFGCLLLIAFGTSRTSLRAADGPAFFESRIRPLLAERCYDCHSARADELKGGLRMDSLDDLLKGGEHGPALVPGQPDHSLLLSAIRSDDPDRRMPRKGPKLSARQVADLTRWIQMGAPWGVAPSTAATAPRDNTPSAKAEAGSWWAFQPVRRPSPPSSPRNLQAIHPIDAFLNARLAEQGLRPNPRATKRALIRRAYFDLLGLPPSPEAIRSFERDSSPDAWTRLVDQLLALPQYGERWGRHWLDVARFAQSNGYERDGEKPMAWRYRDYVVRAFNQDKPYDQFIKEQIAGDELDEVTPDGLTATGFQRLGVWDDEPDDKRMAEFDELDDVLSTTGGAFLGLTLGCARCHDHKFDPIPQADYYRLLAFFRNIRLNEAAKYTLDSANYLPLATSENIRAWQESLRVRLEPLEKRLAGLTNATEKSALAKEIQSLKNTAPPFDWALGVKERGRSAPATHVLVRGNAGSPGAEVQPAFLSAFVSPAPQDRPPAPDAVSCGRRRALAEWIANPANPLTARVLVNRVWHHHFGRGIVKTTSDFGRAGQPPTHPALLDWLAVEFISGGWSIKKLHRTILSSEAYQRSARAGNERAAAVDPGNDLLWRQNLRRLDAEALRDTLLAISGNLNPAMGGRGFFPTLSGEVLAGQSRPGLDWEMSSPAERARRSLYIYVRRTMTVPMMDAFDYNNTTSPLNERPVTTVSSQSLLLLNDSFVQEQAAGLARRIQAETSATRERRPDTDAFIQRGFELATGRTPTRHELRTAREFLRRQESAFRALGTRLTFRPDVPSSLSDGYLEALPRDRFLLGPADGWEYFRGRWSGGYEGIRTVERDRGPFGLASTPPAGFTNGTVTARITPHVACESAGLFVRTRSRDHQAVGYEIALDPREQRIRLRRHENGVSVLGDASAAIPVSESVAVKVTVHDDRLQVWLGDGAAPVLDVTDAQPLTGPGRIGIRSWGAPVSLDDLVVTADGGAPARITDSHLPAPAERAREALCLLLLNLNEVVYVD